MPAHDAIARFRAPHLGRALWQLSTTLALLAGLWGLMWWSLTLSYAVTLLLAVPAAGLVLRAFMIHHDCGHRSFFPAPWANDVTGFALGLLTMTPYHRWRRNHLLHHATSGNLDRRGHGDIYTYTVAEYRRLPAWRRRAYRAFRHPLFLLGVAPLVYFVVVERFGFNVPRRWVRERRWVRVTNVVLLLLFGGAAAWVGPGSFLLLYLPVAALAASCGMWLFLVQHHYEGAYWRRDQEWDHVEAALLGSSHYALPWPLGWFSADIGLHHLHHLDSRIPNYRLRECAAAHPELRAARCLTFRESLRCLSYALWDEEHGRMVRFRDLASAPPGSR